jgi:hypothetical protein
MKCSVCNKEVGISGYIEYKGRQFCTPECYKKGKEEIDKERVRDKYIHRGG